MRFISFRFMAAPAIAPVEYSYQAESETAVGDVVKVRCEEYPVPELVDCIKRLSRPVVDKMFGPDVAAAGLPFRYALVGLELRASADKKPWREEVAFHLMMGNIIQDVKVKTPFFGLYDTYPSASPDVRDNRNQEALGQDVTYGVRELISRCLEYINGTRAQMVLEFGQEEPAKDQELPGFDGVAAVPKG